MSGGIKVRWLIGLAAFAACGTGSAQPPAAPAFNLPKADAPLMLRAGRQQLRVSLVADGLTGPWDLVFIPGTSDLLVTESNGKLRMIQNGKVLPDPVWTPPSPTGNDILHGVVVHPDFARNKLVYVTYLKGDDQRQTLGMSRGRLDGTKLVDVKEIFVADAWENARGSVLWMTWWISRTFGPANISAGGRFEWAIRKDSLFVQSQKACSLSQ